MKHSYIKPQKDRNVGIRNALIAVYIFLSFYEHYLTMMVGSVGKYYIFVLIVLLLMTSEKMHVRTYQYFIVGWLFYKFLSLMWTPSYEVFGSHFISESGFVLLLVCITSLDECELLLPTIKNSLWFCSALMGVLSLFFSQPFEGLSNRFTLTLFGVQNDPNNVVAFLQLGYAISLYSLLYEKKKKILHIAVIIINTYTTLINGSRAGLITILSITAILVLTLYNPKTHKSNYLIILPLAVLLIIVGWFVIQLLPAETAERLFDFETYEGGSNRDIIWAHGLKVLSNPLHLLMGNGWGGYKADGGYGSLHNTFLSILCDTGIFGFCLLFGPIITAILKMLKSKKPLPLTILVSGMVPAFFIEAINKRFFWIVIIYVLIAYNQYLKEEQNVKSTEMLSRSNQTTQRLTN